MRQFLFFSLICLFLSCDDGDLQIETLDFDSATIDMCTPATINTENILFKINDDEALILTLPANILKNEITVVDKPITSAISASGPSKISYRIFSDKVSKSYFCGNIPPVTPVVVDEIEAKNGIVIITTTLAKDGVTYEHDVKLDDITLETSSNSRITDLTVNNFGLITTKP